MSALQRVDELMDELADADQPSLVMEECLVSDAEQRQLAAKDLPAQPKIVFEIL